MELELDQLDAEVGDPGEEEVVPETPSPVVLRQCMIVSTNSQDIDETYPVGLFELVENGDTIRSIAIVLVAELEHRLVVAVPETAWHRTLARRQLPGGALLRPVSVQVDVVDRTVETLEPPFACKVWIGILAPDSEDYVTFAPQDSAEPDVNFAPGGPHLLPSAQSLVSAFEQHFLFASAASGGDRSSSKKNAAFETRFQKLEDSVAAIAESLKGLQLQQPSSRPSALRKTKPAWQESGQSAVAQSAAAADQDVVRAARAAGVPEEDIREMAQLAARGRPHLGDLPKPKGKQENKNVLSESEEEPEEIVEGEDDLTGSHPQLVKSRDPLDRDCRPFGKGQEERSLFRGPARRCWFGRRWRLCNCSWGEKACGSPSYIAEDSFEKPPADFRCDREEHGRGFSDDEPTSRSRFCASYSTCLARDAKSGASLPDSSSPSLGSGWCLGLNSNERHPPGESSLRTSVGNGRSDVYRQGAVAGGGGDKPRRASPHGFISSSSTTCRERSSSHPTGGRALDRPLSAETGRLRSTSRQKEEIECEEDWQGRRHCCERCGLFIFNNSSSEERCKAKREREQGQRRRWLNRANPRYCMKVGYVAPAANLAGRADPLPAFSSTLDSAGFLDDDASRMEHNGRSGSAWPCNLQQSDQFDNEGNGKPPFDSDAVRPPGSLASTVEVKTLWNSMMRWLLQSRCGPLKAFVHSYYASQACRKNHPCTVGPVWPMPLPYPKWRKQGKNLSPHEQALNSMVILLSWMHLGQASKVPSSFSAAAPLTGEQSGVVARLRRLSSAWVGASAVDAEAMGRTAAKIEAMESTVHELTRRAVLLQDFQGSGGLVSAGNVAQRFREELGVVASGEVTSEVQVAKEIEADRLTFGGRPSFNPMPFLDEVTARVYEDPLACSMPPEECLQEPPKVKIRGKRSEVLKLLHKLDDTGRLALFTPQEVRMWFRAGAFSLIKNQTKDRLILDSRPHNLLEEPLSAYTQSDATFA